MVFYGEQAASFSDHVGAQDEVYVGALVRMFGQALKVTGALPETVRLDLLGRRDEVRHISHNFGYGVGDDMDKGTSKNRHERVKLAVRSGHVPSVRRAPELTDSPAQ